MKQLTIKEAAAALNASKAEFITLLQHGSMKVEWYKPEIKDKQSPHMQDELYVIAAGSGTFLMMAFTYLSTREMYCL